MSNRRIASREGWRWALYHWGVRTPPPSPRRPLLSAPPHGSEEIVDGPVELDARSSDLSHDAIRALHRPGTAPIVVRGGADGWAATKGWSLDGFAAEYGDHLVPTDTRSDDGQTVVATLRECIALTRSGAGGYARFSPLIDEHPELTDDLDLAALAAMSGAPLKRTLFHLFIGGAGTTTETHCAIGNNAFVQVHGTKRWYFVPPQFSAALDPLPLGRPYFASTATLHDPSLDSHPSAPIFPVDLHQGDVMLIPPFWWHQVENRTESIGVASRWHHLGHAWSQSPFLTAMTATARHPNVVRANFDRRRFGFVYQETVDQAHRLEAGSRA